MKPSNSMKDAHAADYPERSMPGKTGRKAPGNYQGMNDGGAPKEQMTSMPAMGPREKSSVPENSGHVYPHRPTPKPTKVMEAPQDKIARKKAHGFNERSQNGGANKSAYPSD